MIDIRKFSKILSDNHIEFISGVPDTLLNDFCLYVEANWPYKKHVIAANEGNAIAMAVGYHLSTNTVPLVYMQNSGIGNAVNPLVSLVHRSVYGIPMILLIGWRGEPGVKDHPQHQKQGELSPVLMDDMDIPWKRLPDNIDEVEEIMQWAVSDAKQNSRPVALLVPKRVLEKGEKDEFENQPELLSREEVIDNIVETLPKDTIYVAATGRATRELYEVRKLRGDSHDNDFLNVGAMGHTSSIAAGIALASKNNVVCLEGDSSVLMHLGALTTIGLSTPRNLLHIVLNNGVHESVGGQSSAGLNADLTSIAYKSGYKHVFGPIKTPEEISSVMKEINRNDGPIFIEILIRKGIRKTMPPLRFDLIQSKEKIINALSIR